jgi:hypothetical protein
MPVVSSPRSWFSAILKADVVNVCRVRCEVSKRARGSAEKTGRRRSAIEDTDMKVSICCERRELRVGYGYLFAASSIVILWYKTSVTETDVTMFIHVHNDFLRGS